MDKLKIVFYGTAEFAVPSLLHLCDNGYQPEAVVTAPDKPAGRGREIKKSEVKIAAESLGLRILQPTNLKADDFYETIKEINPNLQVVVAFRMMPEKIWSYPQFGSINLHSSLLPQYRGAAPIHWAIINGEKETGVSTFFLKHEIDTGDIILQEKEAILPEDTLGSLYSRLKEKGAQLLVKTVKAIESGNPPSSAQVLPDEVKHAPKIHKHDSEINWEKSPSEITNLVRGTNPFPGAWTMLNGNKYKVHRVAISEKEILDPGKWMEKGGKQLFVGCNEGAIEILEIQPEGKKKMKTEEFLRGNSI